MKKKKKVRVKYKNILIFLAVIVLIAALCYYFMNLKISNIFIKGNTMFTDQEIIRLAGIEDYPETLITTSNMIKTKLKKEKFIYKALVKKKKLTQVYIEIEENYPLYYYKGNTVLYNGKKINEKLNCPIFVNEIPSKIKFNEAFKEVDRAIVNRISEIKYTPDDVDKNLFRFTMNDGNYVYITLSKIEKINKYIDFVKEFNNKSGTLYLNSGEYFKIN